MRPFPAPPRASGGKDIQDQIRYQENRLSRHKAHHRYPSIEEKSHQDSLQALITALYDDFYLTSLGMSILRRKSKMTGDPVFLEMVEDSKKKSKEGLALYEANLNNPLPCSYLSLDGINSRLPDRDHAIRFDFVLVKTSKEETMVPLLQYYEEKDSLKNKLMFWNSQDGDTQYSIQDRDTDNTHAHEVVVDKELVEALNTWTKNYDESAEGITGTSKRSEIYSLIQDYVPARLALDELSQFAHSELQKEQVAFEEDLVSDTRNTLMLMLEETTAIMVRYVGLDERDSLVEQEAVESHDLTFSHRMEKYRSNN